MTVIYWPSPRRPEVSKRFTSTYTVKDSIFLCFNKRNAECIFQHFFFLIYNARKSSQLVISVLLALCVSLYFAFFSVKRHKFFVSIYFLDFTKNAMCNDWLTFIVLNFFFLLLLLCRSEHLQVWIIFSVPTFLPVLCHFSPFLLNFFTPFRHSKMVRSNILQAFDLPQCHPTIYNPYAINFPFEQKTFSFSFPSPKQPEAFYYLSWQHKLHVINSKNNNETIEIHDWCLTT